ncbi:MAG: type 4a pilus biogenesis protein PilO [Gemmatimonadetes bacterium]|nr:type 4a pilus biogenesis protein PilO [Gemmatimonadota bacterium]
MALLPADPQQRQKVLLGALLIVLVSYGVYTYLYTPRTQELTALQSRLETLQLQNRAARALTTGAGTAEIERDLALYRDQLVTVEALIPSSEEVPDLLDAISAEAQRIGVELSLIRPVGATAEEYYTRRTYDLAVLGSYHQVGEFLTRIASLPRIVTPTNLRLTPRQDATRAGEPRLEATFTIETYVLPSPTDVRDTTAAS